MSSSPEKPLIGAWKAFTPAEYSDIAGRLVHFSAKGVNSNAEAFGIRLGSGSALPLPYVSARCLMAAGVSIAVDYIKNAGKTATVVKQLHALLDGGAATEREPDAAEACRAALADLPPEVRLQGTEGVNPRLRQILLPRDDGYLAVSPLPCGGLSREINRRVRTHNDKVIDAKRSRPARAIPVQRIRLGRMGVGGANPQNVGALVRDMQTVVMFLAPIESVALRHARQLHQSGMSLDPPRRELDALLHARRAPSDGEDTDRALARALVDALLRRGERARRALETCREHLPGGRLLSPALEDPVLRGLIDPSERVDAWPERCAERIAAAILDRESRDAAARRIPPDRLRQWIAEALR